MKFSELKRSIDLHHRPDHYEDAEVVIQIKLPYATVGGTPTVPLKSVMNGFDWDNGKFILVPEENLTPSDWNFAEQMQKMQERVGWTELENRNLKAEIKRLKKQLKVEE